jgi:AcrR family transcriptional regulator
MGLRERNKSKRRDAIVEATLDLARTRSLADVSIELIAAQAEVAPATVYNLIGSRDLLLHACIDRVVDRLVDALVLIDPVTDPLRAAVAIVEQSVEAFVADRNAYRQIIATIGNAGTGSMLTIDPAQLQIAAMRAAQTHGILRDDIDPVALGRQISLSYNGALLAWARRLLTDDGLRLATLHGLWTALAAAASDTQRHDFLENLRVVGRQLTKAGWGND